MERAKELLLLYLLANRIEKQFAGLGFEMNTIGSRADKNEPLVMTDTLDYIENDLFNMLADELKDNTEEYGWKIMDILKESYNHKSYNELKDFVDKVKFDS